ncbi:MAG TPA: transcription antitermination factor NusB [Microscillaceae bacterium]|nr:transcription antitermination factor NusB [Microscillaceae bacterium]
MLNRRYLRMKVMQVLYALDLCKKADSQLALDHLVMLLTPDIYKDKDEIASVKEDIAQATIVLENNLWVSQALLQGVEGLKPTQKSAIEDALRLFQNKIKQENLYFERYLNSYLEVVFDQYLRLLLLIGEITEFERVEVERLKTNFLYKTLIEQDYKLKQNPLCEAVLRNQILQQLAQQRKVDWSQGEEFISELYRTVVKAEAGYNAIPYPPNYTFEDIKTPTIELFRAVLFQHDYCTNYFNEIDINWEENRSIVKDMIIRTLKSIEANAKADFDLLPVSRNWEEDKEFSLDLYKKTVAYDDMYEEIIIEKAANWDLSRLAMIDKILLKMAMAEMLYFQNIPVKVTINEYIELSKTYSTPKSKQFVNGLLDAISADFTAQQKIKKSGKGLLDNK